MQSYLQYRRLWNSVCVQLDHAYVQRNANTNVKRDSTSGSSSGSGSATSCAIANRINGDDAAEVTPSPEPLEKSKTQRCEKTALAYSLPGVDIQKEFASTNQPVDLFIASWDGRECNEVPVLDYRPRTDHFVDFAVYDCGLRWSGALVSRSVCSGCWTDFVSITVPSSESSLSGLLYRNRHKFCHL